VTRVDGRIKSGHDEEETHGDYINVALTPVSASSVPKQRW
jgi:hypothetical protein